jgi:hypothetical protein
MVYLLSLSMQLMTTAIDPGLPGFLFRACQALTASIAHSPPRAPAPNLADCIPPVKALTVLFAISKYYNTRWDDKHVTRPTWVILSCSTRRRALVVVLLYSYPLSSWHSHYNYTLKGKRLKQRGGKGEPLEDMQWSEQKMILGVA